MLQPKVIAAIVFIWVVAAIIGGIMEQSMLGAEEEGVLNALVHYEVATTEGEWGIVQLAAAPIGLMQNLWNLVTFQFKFVTGVWEYVRWIVFAPISAMVIYGMIMTVVNLLRGTIGSS